jgi:hypothetical protein
MSKNHDHERTKAACNDRGCSDFPAIGEAEAAWRAASLGTAADSHGY